ncbi:MAG: hypothetical protein ACK4UQ_05080 [Brevundimonas sp.]
MSISSVAGFLGNLAGLSGTGSTRQNAPLEASSARSDMTEIREKGLSEWAREQKMEALKAKIRDQILGENRLTESGVAALPVQQRNSVEDQIAQLVQQKLEETLQRSMDDAARSGKTEAVLLDISV